MRVLVTGGAGRLGATACRALLQEGFSVRVLDLDSPRSRGNLRQAGPGLEVQWGDVTRPDVVRAALEGVDAVVHMAAVLPPAADLHPDLAWQVNVGGTRVLVDMIKDRGGRLPLVFTSSVAVFGPTPHATEPLSAERHTPAPQGGYATSKLEAERVIGEAGLDHVILRLSAAMYLSFGVSDLKRMFAIPLDNRVEFCHPDDAALAIVRAIGRFETVKGQTLIISGGPSQRMLYRDMVGAILGVLGLPLPPAHKFATKPAYLDWYDTERSQELLEFQHSTFADYLRDYRRELERRLSPPFVGFMRWFAGPVLGGIIVRCM
ncbi:MAG: NAD(P)-dependent oxidoreductase [Acetobacteraceae bacterium]|nr:NAD(P)-dependent oxidoreductase [Acetobacteraceae bacterium]